MAEGGEVGEDVAPVCGERGVFGFVFLLSTAAGGGGLGFLGGLFLLEVV